MCARVLRRTGVNFFFLLPSLTVYKKRNASCTIFFPKADDFSVPCSCCCREHYARTIKMKKRLICSISACGFVGKKSCSACRNHDLEPVTTSFSLPVFSRAVWKGPMAMPREPPLSNHWGERAVRAFATPLGLTGLGMNNCIFLSLASPPPSYPSLPPIVSPLAL